MPDGPHYQGGEPFLVQDDRRRITNVTAVLTCAVAALTGRDPGRCTSYNVRHFAYNESMGATRVRVSRNGQVSVPAAVRHRWGTATVLIIDRGDYAIIRPVPDDPVEALRGAYTTPGPTSEETRSASRSAEAASEERRQADVR